jgi:hypothetical protein
MRLPRILAAIFFIKFIFVFTKLLSIFTQYYYINIYWHEKILLYHYFIYSLYFDFFK